MANSNTTTNHDKIRKWAEARNGGLSIVWTQGKGGIFRDF